MRLRDNLVVQSTQNQGIYHMQKALFEMTCSYAT
jgi:hypothetical protein